MEIPRRRGVTKANVFKGNFLRDLGREWKGFKSTTLCGRGMSIFWNNSIILRCIGLKVRALSADVILLKFYSLHINF